LLATFSAYWRDNRSTQIPAPTTNDSEAVMPILSKKYLRFDEGDVELMKAMMKKFNEFHSALGAPDFSFDYSPYLPVFVIALLSSEESLDKLTKELVWLTRVIALFSIALAVLTLVLLVKAR
jgi:hypothetical protein